MAIVDKMNYLKETKNQIKNAIIEKGVGIEDTDSFRSYVEKIGQIEGGTQGGFADYIVETSTSMGYNPSYIFQRIFKKVPNNIVSFLNASNIGSMSDVFRGCYNLTELNLNNLNTTSVNNMSNMFFTCQNISELNLSSFDTSNVTTMERMFYGCKKLISINGILNLISVNNLTSMFFDCPVLQSVNIKNLNKTGLDLSKSVNLLKDSLMYLINNLVSTTTAKTVTLGATNLAKLTEEEIAIATEKGWTLA